MKESEHHGTLIDNREQPEQSLLSPWERAIPKGVTNTVWDIKTGENDNIVGAIQVGTNGFIEAIIWSREHLFKLKKYPDMNAARIGQIAHHSHIMLADDIKQKLCELTDGRDLEDVVNDLLRHWLRSEITEEELKNIQESDLNE